MISYVKRHHGIRLLVMLFVIVMSAASVFAAVDEQESNNKMQSANPVRMGTTVYGITDDYDFDGIETGFDWFKFTAPVSGTAFVVIHADYLPLNFTSAELNVYDSNNNKITRAYDDQSAYGGKSVRFGVTSGRTYYIRVCCDYAGYCSPDAEYHFYVGYSIGKTSVTSKKGIKRGFKVNWTRKAKASYYQVQYTKKSTYSDYYWNRAKTVNVTSNSKTIKKLARKRTYYVRVRVVRKINGVTYYSPWSAAKAVKTK